MIAINNYLTIPGFAVSELHLSGADRDTYSYIYSKSQDGLPTAIKISWIAEWETCSERAIERSLRRLESKGLICVVQRSGLPSLYNVNNEAKNKALDTGHTKLPDKDPRRIRSDITDDDYIEGKLRQIRHGSALPEKEGADSKENLKTLLASGANWTWPGILNQDIRKDKGGN